MTPMEKRLLLALDSAIASKGKHKGKLKAKCPPMGTDGAVMWQALMTYANPYKIGIGHLLWGSVSDPEFKSACDSYAREKGLVLRHLDRDRVALERLGAW